MRYYLLMLLSFFACAHISNAGMVGLWKFESSEDRMKVKDLSGGHRNANFPDNERSKYLFVGGKSGTALKLDQDASGLVIKNAEELSFNEKDDFSILAWVKPENARYGTIISSFDKSDGRKGQGYSVSVSNYNIMLRFATHTVSNGKVKRNANVYGTTRKYPFVENQWHHIAIVYKGGGAKPIVKFYVDGELEHTKVYELDLRGSIQKGNTVYIGNSNSYSKPFTGGIDELTVYDHLVSDVRLREIFAQDNYWNASQGGDWSKDTLWRNSTYYDGIDKKFYFPELAPFRGTENIPIKLNKIIKTSLVEINGSLPYTFEGEGAIDFMSTYNMSKLIVKESNRGRGSHSIALDLNCFSDLTIQTDLGTSLTVGKK